MKKNKTEKKTIWLYAVILFTSAFVVLLLTAYSQIKFNKNIDEYKNRISNGEMEKVNFKTDLSTSIEENKKLKAINDVLILDKNKLQKDIEKLNEDVKIAEQKNYQDKYEALIIAINKYEQGDIEGCAEMLYRLHYTEEMLGEKGFSKYNELIEKTFKPAAQKIYETAYREYYLKKMYPSAIKRFRLSIGLASNEYFSDDCLYLLANSELNSGNKDEAKRYLNQLIENYKDSNYYLDAKELLKQI